MKFCFRLLVVVAFLAGPLRAELTLVSLNCFLCFSPENNERIQIADIAAGRLNSADYKEKMKDLAKLAATAKPDVIGLQEIGSGLEAADLAKEIQAAWPQGGAWQVCFVQGSDHQTGEDVATLVRIAAAKVVNFSRDDKTLKKLSKHLVTTLDVKGVQFGIVTVHLVRPMMGQEAHHAEQISELKSWVKANKKKVAPVVIGDFNDTAAKLLPLHEAGEFTHHAPTHMDKKEYDHIFAPTVKEARVTTPPYPLHPDHHMLSLWTDHLMLSAVIDK